MLLSFIEVLILLVPLLLAVAFLTLAERKAMGSIFLFILSAILFTTTIRIYFIIERIKYDVSLIMNLWYLKYFNCLFLHNFDF